MFCSSSYLWTIITTCLVDYVCSTGLAAVVGKTREERTAALRLIFLLNIQDFRESNAVYDVNRNRTVISLVCVYLSGVMPMLWSVSFLRFKSGRKTVGSTRQTKHWIDSAKLEESMINQ